MSLHPHAVSQVPEETRRVAHAAFPHGTLCLHIADALGLIYEDYQVADLFPPRGQRVGADRGAGHTRHRRAASAVCKSGV
jgi:transposase